MMIICVTVPIIRKFFMVNRKCMAKGMDYSELLVSSIKKIKEKSDKRGIIIISTLQMRKS